jgi:hypothetical protein
MNDDPTEEFERRFKIELPRQADELVGDYDPSTVALEVIHAKAAGKQRWLVVAGTIGAAALLTVGAMAVLQRPDASHAGDTISSPSQADASADVRAQAQKLLDGLLGTHPGNAAAAAYVTTTYKGYAATPDALPIEGPSPSDPILVVTVEGWFPASHSCGFMVTACFDTGIELVYDIAMDKTIHVSYFYDPNVADDPLATRPLGARFVDLRQWGDPVPLQLDANSPVLARTDSNQRENRHRPRRGEAPALIGP